MSQPKKEGRRVSIQEAHNLCNANAVIDIFWRPEPDLPEKAQYALIYGEEDQ